MIFRASDGISFVIQAELFEAREELFLMLSAKQSEHPIEDGLFVFFDSDHELQAEKVLVVQMGLGGDGGRGHVDPAYVA